MVRCPFQSVVRTGDVSPERGVDMVDEKKELVKLKRHPRLGYIINGGLCGFRTPGAPFRC